MSMVLWNPFVLARPVVTANESEPHVSILKKIIYFKYIMWLNAISLNSFNKFADILQLEASLMRTH